MKRIAIFGGSGGLGASVTKNLSKDYHLMIGYNKNKEKANSLFESIDKAGYKAEILYVDVCDTESIKDFLKISNTNNDLDGVVNAVGPAIPLKP